MKPFRSPYLFSALLVVSVSPVLAAPGDELVGEQSYDIGATPDPEASFWDPQFWRDTTAPLESPIVPGDQNFLYFRSKNHLGEPMATPATGMTLKTGSALGFSPPVTAPALGRVYFSDNILRFDGAPDVPGGAWGRLSIAHPHPLQLESASSVDFDRTIVQTNNTAIYSRSGIQITGDVSASGVTTNFSNPGTTTIERVGAGAVSPVLVRQSAVATLGSAVYSFALHSVDSNTGNAPVFRAESGGALTLTNAVLSHPTGVVFDADASSGNSSILLGGAVMSGKHAGADPLTVFRATGNGTPSAEPEIRVTGISQFSDLTGTFARASSGARIAFEGKVVMTDANIMTNVENLFRVMAESGGKVEFSELDTALFTSSGTARVDWSADGGGCIDGGAPIGGFVHLSGGAHTAVATGGGEIRMIPNMGADPGAVFTLQALGSGSVLSFPNSMSLESWDSGGGGTFSHYTIEARNGASLVGGSVIDFGSSSYPDLRSVAVQHNANPSTVTMENASASCVNLILADHTQVVVGGSTGSTLRHVHFNLGPDCDLTVTGGTWRPDSAASQFYRQELVFGGETGGSTATLTGAAVAHEVDVNAGQGGFSEGGAPPPFDMCTLTVSGGSVWTGALDAATFSTGRAAVVISGTGTTAGLRRVNLGATAYPQINSGPGMPGFDGSFFTNLGGDADLTVSSGARVSIGCYTDAFGTWVRPEMFAPASMICNGSDIQIDATSAVFLGDAATPAAVDHRNGALVVGAGGYLLGTGVVHGAAAGGDDLVVAGGHVSPGFSPGTMAVDGGFRMESGTLVLEVGSGLPGGFDRISADRIRILGGTIRIVPAFGFTPGLPFNVNLFDTLDLDMAPGVVIEIDPQFAGSTFDPGTGLFSVAGAGGGGDADGDGIPDIIEEVLPAQGSGVEWPSVARNPAGGSVFSFRRKDSSENNRIVAVQWSTGLTGWTDIPVPPTTTGVVTVDENGTDPDLIQVVLPDPAGQARFFVRLKVE